MTFDPSKPFEKVEEAPKSEGFDPNQPFDVVEEKSIGQRNLEKFGPADVSPSFMEQVLDVATPVTAGLSQGLTAGFGDEIVGAGTAVAKDIGSLFGLSEAGDYEAERDVIRAATDKAAEESPVLYTGAEIGGAIGGAAVAPGAALAKAIGQGALYGAGKADTMEDVPEDAAMGAALGGIGAKALPLAATGAKKLGQKVVDRSAAKMAAKLQTISDEAAVSAGAARDKFLGEAAETAAKKAKIEEYATTLKAKKAYERAYNRLKKQGKYSDDKIERMANEASDKIIDTAATRAEIAAHRATETAKIKADKLYNKLHEKAIKEGKKAIEKPKSDFSIAKDVLLGGGKSSAGDIMGAATRAATGISGVKFTAGMAKKLGLKTAKGLSGISDKSLQALNAASERGGGQALMATHNMLLQTDEKYRKAITKNQESE